MTNVIDITEFNQNQGNENYRKQVARNATLDGKRSKDRLKGWKVKISESDRRVIARNLTRILEEYQVNHNDLSWDRYYGEKMKFSRDINRMTLKEGQEKKTIIAYANKYLNILYLIRDHLKQSKTRVSIEKLSHSLIKGTALHSTFKNESEELKVMYLLEQYAQDIDENLQLLEMYRVLATAKAEYFRLNNSLIGEIMDFEAPKYLNHSADLHFSCDLSESNLSGVSFKNYSEENWEHLISSAAIDLQSEIIRVRDSVTSYIERELHYKNSLTCLHYSTELDTQNEVEEVFDIYDLFSFELRYLPRWFMGVEDWWGLGSVTSCEQDKESYPSELIVKEGDGRFESCLAYVALYPNKEFTRLIPILVHFMEEGTYTKELTLYDLQEFDCNFFQPKPTGEKSVSRGLMDRIKDDLKTCIKQSWEESAKDMSNHPYILWSKERNSILDEL